MSKFYVYGYFREDGTPYYIGKGTGYRATTQSCHAVKVPVDRSRIRILADGLSDEEAREWEKGLIALLGRKVDDSGCLRNLTLGGEGIAGFRFSEESKRKMSESSKGTNLGPQSAAHKEAKAEALRQRITWQHEKHGSIYCSASELIERFDGLSKAGLSRIKNGKYSHYKGWSVAS